MEHDEPDAPGLSPMDRLIFDSHKNLMDALGAYLGEAFELVLHNLTDYDHSVAKIVNGFHSGRKEGAPITDVALSLLEKVQRSHPSAARPGQPVQGQPVQGQPVQGQPAPGQPAPGQPAPGPAAQSAVFTLPAWETYFSRTKYGKPVKSATAVIFGENHRAIGLFCINMYLDSPISALTQGWIPASSQDFVTEHFGNDSTELLRRMLDKVRGDILHETGIPVSQKNKEIITRLYYMGFFRLKNAVPAIAQALGISRSTVYMHIRPLEEGA